MYTKCATKLKQNFKIPHTLKLVHCQRLPFSVPLVAQLAERWTVVGNMSQ